MRSVLLNLNLGFVSVWEGSDSMMNVGSFGGSLDFLVGSPEASVADVVADVIVEEDRILRNNADYRPGCVLAFVNALLNEARAANHAFSCIDCTMA